MSVHRTFPTTHDLPRAPPPIGPPTPFNVTDMALVPYTRPIDAALTTTRLRRSPSAFVSINSVRLPRTLNTSEVHPSHSSSSRMHARIDRIRREALDVQFRTLEGHQARWDAMREEENRCKSVQQHIAHDRRMAEHARSALMHATAEQHDVEQGDVMHAARGGRTKVEKTEGVARKIFTRQMWCESSEILFTLSTRKVVDSEFAARGALFDATMQLLEAHRRRFLTRIETLGTNLCNYICDRVLFTAIQARGPHVDVLCAFVAAIFSGYFAVAMY